MNKVLIVSNPLNHEGGVVNYYNLFFKFFTSEKFELNHFRAGSRAYLFTYPLLKKILYPLYFIFDLFRYIFILIFDRSVKIVQVNPSLILVPLIRDAFFIIVAKIFNKKVIVFYRGWIEEIFLKISSNKFLKKCFNNIYQKKTQQIVLASSFKESLERLGKPLVPVLVTTTSVDDGQIILTESNNDVIKVLFLGRIQDIKGVGEIVKSIIILNEMGQLKNFYFIFAGREDKAGYTNMLKKELKDNNIPADTYNFIGYISGKNKYEVLASSDVFLMPSYTEGCPNSVLEALASGLFCITTNVGALRDIIIPGENGLLVEKKSPEDIAEAFVYLLNNKRFLENRLDRGRKYSKEFNIYSSIKLFNNLYEKIIS